MLSEAYGGKLKIIQGDVLKLDNEAVLAMAEELLRPAGLSLHSQSPSGQIGRLKLVGNLPFGVATPLLIRWLRDTATKTGLMRAPRVDMSLMFQREVAVVSLLSEESSLFLVACCPDSARTAASCRE